jgi:hypothetical protein
MAKKKFSFMIGTQFVLEDTTPELNQQFVTLYNHFFTGKTFEEGQFRTCAKNYFNINKGNFEAHDAFFNNFTILTGHFLKEGKLLEIEKIWSFALNIAYEWEKENARERIHKGSPYHFLGITYLLFGDLVKGFLHIHQALEEDKKTQNKKCPHTPGYHFVTLNYDQSVYGQDLLKIIAAFVEEKLAQYRKDRNGSLAIAEFKTKFLEKEALVDTIFSFVYIIFNLYKLEKGVNKEFVQSDFASLLETNLIFDLCLVIDSIVKTVDNSQYFAEHFDYMASRSLLTVNTAKAREANDKFKTNFGNTLVEFLSGTFTFADNSKPTSIETDLLVVYGFRNYSAHSIESQKIIYQKFFEIIQRVLNALFFSVEKLL